MTSIAYNTEYQSLYLKDYARFVIEHKLEDLVASYLMNLHSFDIPLLEFFSHLTEEELLVVARQSVTKLLNDLKNGTAIEQVEKNLRQWQQNRMETIKRESVSLKDITLIYSAQKISFQSFLPYYTTEVSIATQVINEIDHFYKYVQEMALQMLELIRKQEYEKRLESEERYRNLFDNASDIIHISNAESEILYVNHAWTATLGYQLEELRGRSIFDFIKKEQVANFKNMRAEAIAQQKPSLAVRINFIKKNGGEAIAEGAISYKYKNGKVEFTTALLHDITSKLEQEKQIQFYIDQLADREKNLRDIIENAPDGVIVIDKDNTITLWNPKAQEIFGWSNQEATGRKITDILVPPEHRNAHAKGVERYMRTREMRILNQTVEVPAIHKLGHQFYISLTVSHSMQNGKDIFIAFLRDISNQKKNELELENKRKQLEKSNEELEQYAWLTSHDLKEPLRKILTFSDALIKKDAVNLSEQGYNYLQKIHSAAGRMKSLIEAVLSYSNVSSDLELFVDTDLNDILAGVIEDLEISIEQKGAIIEHESLPVIEAIPIQMTQLFQNVISNSIKYSKPGISPHITISCQEEKEGFKITIVDNGIGFEKMYADKIFHVFQRLHNKSYEGTGIGLALCKKITDAHKGSIYAESEPGKGSTFIIYLPKKHLPNSPAT